jgi:hypothetical protein
MEWIKYKKGGDFDSPMQLFVRTYWVNKEWIKED